MDKLSSLIKEARPLYKERKRRNSIFKILVLIIVPAIFIFTVAQLYIEGDEVYMSIENNNLQKELLSDDFGLLR